MQSSYGLSTTYLQDLCEKLLPHFSGVVSCDNLSEAFPHLSQTQCAIVNSMEAEISFGHWLAVIFDVHKDKFIFWDPLGFPLSMYPQIETFLKQSGKRINCLRHAIQHMTLSVHCGYFSLAFLLSFEIGIDPNSFFQLFDKNDLLLNDDISVIFIKACIKKLQSSRL